MSYIYCKLVIPFFIKKKINFIYFQAQQSHPNSRAAQYQRTPMENILLGNRPAYAAYNNQAISMQPVNSHNQANAPPPLVRSGAGQSANHM